MYLYNMYYYAHSCLVYKNTVSDALTEFATGRNKRIAALCNTVKQHTTLQVFCRWCQKIIHTHTTQTSVNFDHFNYSVFIFINGSVSKEGEMSSGARSEGHTESSWHQEVKHLLKNKLALLSDMLWLGGVFLLSLSRVTDTLFVFNLGGEIKQIRIPWRI